MVDKTKKEETLTPKDIDEGKDDIDIEIEKEIEAEKSEETEESKEDEKPEEPEKEDAGPEGSIEVDGKLYKVNPEKPEEPLLNETGEKILFEEKKESKTPEGAIEVDGVLYKEDPENLGDALSDGDGKLVLFEKPKRTPRLVPIYKLKIAEKNWNKDKKVMQETIDKLNKKIEERPDLSKDSKIEAFAEKHKMNPDILKGLIKLVAPKGMIVSDELQNDITQLKKDSAWKKEFDEFDKDYSKNVLPLLKGEKTSEEDRGKIKKLLKAKAFTTEYANTPLPVIFRGDTDFDSFRGVVTKKKTAEKGGKGLKGVEPGKSKISLESSDEEFDEFEKELEEDSKKDGLTVRRGAKDVKV